jgi:hypothetical protein
MVDLNTIKEKFENCDALPTRARQMANACMIGITFNNQLCGRSGEWQYMTAAHAVEQIENNESYFVCEKYKTAKTYGVLGKYISDGTKKAMSIYLSLPGRNSDLLFEPALSKSPNVHVAAALQSFQRLYLSSYEVMTVTLLRKNVHTMIDGEEAKAKCMALLCKVDRHRVATGQKHYVLHTAKGARLIVVI